MSREILIAEDSRLDVEAIASAAQQWGTTTRVDTFSLLMETLASAHRYDLLILDLRMDGTEPRNTVQSVQLAIAKLRLPVIVVTGYSDNDLRRDCESHGMLWVDKESDRFKADLYHAIQRSFDGHEDSGDKFVALSSSREQLAAIVSKLDRMETKQNTSLDVLTSQFSVLSGKVNRILDQMWGPLDENDFRSGGCVQRHKKAMSIVNAGGVYLWAVVMGTTGIWAAIVAWFISKVTQ